MFCIQQRQHPEWITVWEGDSYREAQQEWKWRTSFCVQRSGVCDYPEEKGRFRLLKDGEVMKEMTAQRPYHGATQIRLS